MPSQTPVRRSGRHRMPNKKYTDTISLPDDSGDSPSGAISDAEGAKQDSSSGGDDDFEAPETELNDANDRDERQHSEGSEDSDFEHADDASAGDEEAGDIQSDRSSLKGKRKMTRKLKKKPAYQKSWIPKPPPPLRSRNFQRDKSLWSNRQTPLVGPDPSDVMAIQLSSLKWGGDEIVPQRVAFENGVGGMAHHPLYTLEKRKIEQREGWSWYDHGGGERMRQQQNMEKLDLETAQKYIPKAFSFQRLLLGPVSKQKSYDIYYMDSISIRDVSAQVEENGESSQAHLNFEQRNGWIINVGVKIRSLDWAPNQGGLEQFLAVATFKEPPPGVEPKSTFVPAQSHPSCIQIWVVHSNIGDEGYSYIDNDQQPQLAHAICAEWGEVKQLKWNPASRCLDKGDEDTIFVGLLGAIFTDGYLRVLDVRIDLSEDQSSNTFVRYNGSAFASKPADTICKSLAWTSPTQLAVGCANGSVAIWDIASAITGQNTQSEQPDRDSSDDVPMSGTEADNITSTNLNDQPQSTEEDPAPIFYVSLHQSFILDLVSTYPVLPHFLLTTSVDGYVRLTDIRSPYFDTVTAQRSRQAGYTVAYSPHVQGCIAPEDTEIIRILPLRRFFGSITTVKARGQVTRIATSPVHANVMVAATDGSVILFNPIDRVLKKRAFKMSQQYWFIHEWAPAELPSMPEDIERIAREYAKRKEGKGESEEAQIDETRSLEMDIDDEKSSRPPADGYSANGQQEGREEPPLPPSESIEKDPAARASSPSPSPSELLEQEQERQSRHPRPGGSRFVEGFRPETPDFHDRPSGIPTFETIHEVETAVTCVVWNPNPWCGGWAAAGTASGLIRIEDIAAPMPTRASTEAGPSKPAPAPDTEAGVITTPSPDSALPIALDSEPTMVSGGTPGPSPAPA